MVTPMTDAKVAASIESAEPAARRDGTSWNTLGNEMAKSENKTVPTHASPRAYVAAIGSAAQRADAEWLLEMMERIVGEPPRMWGPSIIGFGQYHYRYASGREGDGMLAGFAPRKGNIVVYLVGEIPEQAELLRRLGPHRMGKACLDLKKLDDIDRAVLEDLVSRSVAAQRAKYPDHA